MEVALRFVISGHVGHADSITGELVASSDAEKNGMHFSCHTVIPWLVYINDRMNLVVNAIANKHMGHLLFETTTR